MLSDRVALVTGSSSGIGKRTAIELAAAGADVAVHYHSNESGAETTADAVAERERDTTVVSGDIADTDEVQDFVDEAASALGPIDILVNNAGLSFRAPPDEMTYETWNRVIQVNLSGVFNVSQAVFPQMVSADGGGAAINISSTWSLQGGTDLAAYSAAKGGINALTRQLCKQWTPHGVRVNTITSGPIVVEKHRERRKATESAELIERIIPVGRYGRTEEIAHAVVFLASDKASFIAGENLVIDGGMTSTSCR